MLNETLTLEEVLKSVDSRTKKSENFLSVQNNVASELENSTKQLYDLTKETTKRKNDALPELVIEGFDEEQIWQQLELQNEAELTHFLTRVSRVLAGNGKLELPLSGTKDARKSETSETSEHEDEAEKVSDRDSEESDEDMDLDEEEDINKKSKKSRKTEFKRHIKNHSIVDDKFFKLEELDEYLTKEDKKETQGSKTNKQEDEDEGSDEESVDLFDAVSGDEDDDEEETEDGKMMKYADFFDSPEDEGEKMNVSEFHEDNASDEEFDPENFAENQNDEFAKKESKKSKSDEKRVKFNLTNDSDDTDSLEPRNENRADESESKSSLEGRQARLQRRIKELENEAISEKPWQLKGEVSAANRPQNSLLEEFVEFDITARPAPVITEQTTIKLEDIIKQRIKDKAWDDVERKFKPVETPLEYKKKLVMDQEKSKKSLAQIYEDAYVKQKEALDPENAEREVEEPKEHVEIRGSMHSLFRKLDALSNFHYTPKQAQPEIKIVSNVPAINMEEVAPVATTDATLLAPEEVKSKPRGELVGRGERTSTDMKRERRKKKLKQRVHQKASEAKEKTLAEKLKPAGKKYTKGEAAAVIKKLTKDRNIVKMDETSNKITKSSTAFFAQLQDQVKSQIKSKVGNAVKKKQKHVHSAVKLKL